MFLISNVTNPKIILQQYSGICERLDNNIGIFFILDCYYSYSDKIIVYQCIELLS